jgi:hypothetical protein
MAIVAGVNVDWRLIPRIGFKFMGCQGNMMLLRPAPEDPGELLTGYLLAR